MGSATVTPFLPSEAEDTTLDKEPEAILDRITVKRRGMLITKVLVKWKHQLPKDATWEFYYDLKQKFLLFKS